MFQLKTKSEFVEWFRMKIWSEFARQMANFICKSKVSSARLFLFELEMLTHKHQQEKVLQLTFALLHVCFSVFSFFGLHHLTAHTGDLGIFLIQNILLFSYIRACPLHTAHKNPNLLCARTVSCNKVCYLSRHRHLLEWIISDFRSICLSS